MRQVDERAVEAGAEWERYVDVVVPVSAYSST